MRIAAKFSWLTGLALFLSGILCSAAFAESRLACEAYQLESYRRQYRSGDECWQREKSMKGATEYCCNQAFGSKPQDCRRDEARINIDWVFNDAGARATYQTGRRGGQTPFEACIRAQGHNPRAARVIQECSSFSMRYCEEKDRQLRGDSQAPVGCEGAEKAALWVLFLDDRARLVYDVRIGKGDSRFDALVFALGHDAAAQRVVKTCKPWVVDLLARMDWKP